jgi:hypothetical protein
MLRLILLVTALLVSSCSDDDKKDIGEPCDQHAECASGLCTIPIPAPDGGVAPQKRCTKPNM